MNNHVVPLNGTSKDVNEVISELKVNPAFKAGGVSDGYHTFDELYEHRIVNYIALCKIHQIGRYVWRSHFHSDATKWEGWFILGINIDSGEQITYHLPISKWDDCWFATDRPKAPDFDGHTSADVLKRIGEL